MANNLESEKKVLAISMLAEGSSIRAIERITGVHRDTIMRLGVRVGEARISRNGKAEHLGHFQSEAEAISAYNAAAIRQWGEFATPNVYA